MEQHKYELTITARNKAEADAKFGVMMSLASFIGTWKPLDLLAAAGRYLLVSQAIDSQEKKAVIVNYYKSKTAPHDQSHKSPNNSPDQPIW